MKMNIMVSSLAFALAITLASTGCAHKPVNVTHIPGPTPPPVADNQNINTIPYNQQNEPPIGNQNQIATATDWESSQYDFGPRRPGCRYDSFCL